MTRRRPFAVLVAVMLVASCFATPAGAVIFGEDDRLEHFECNRRYKEYARSIAAIVPLRNLERDGQNYRWKLGDIPTLRDIVIDGKRVDPEERFVNQPLCGVGTAFLIAPDVIVTAGHCVVDELGQTVIRDMAIVFDYHIDPATQQVNPEVPAENVYRCESAVVINFNPATGEDYAIIRLDRAVEGRTPLEVRQEGTVEEGTRLVTIGHPMGLPSKVAINARVRENAQEEYFRADIDAFPGNSGSPVLDARTGIVEGILVRGGALVAGESYVYGPQRSWRLDPISDLLEVRRNEITDAVDVGTAVQRINLIPEIAGGFAQGLALFAMIAEGKTQEVLTALESGINPNIRDAEDRHLLHQAMRFSNLEVAEALIDLEVPILLRDVNDSTPLHEAAEEGFLDGIELLVEYDHPVNVVDKYGRTALWLSRGGEGSIIDYLREEGAEEAIIPHQIVVSLEEEEIGMYQAMWQAIQVDSGPIVELLITEYHVDPTERFVGVWENGDLVDARPFDPVADQREGSDVYDRLYLHLAASAGAYRVVETLLDAGVDPNVVQHSSGWTALHQTRSIKVATALVASGANVNAVNMWGATPLSNQVTYIAYECGPIDYLQFLLDNGADIDLGGAVFRIVDSGYFCQRGHEYHHPQRAASYTAILQFLIENGADVNATKSYSDGEVDTLLDFAIEKEYEDAIALIRRAGGRRGE